jgi:hypothetical protein
MANHKHLTPSNYSDEWRVSPHPLALDFVPRAVVDLFPLLSCSSHPVLHKYLAGRGISEKTYQHFKVRFNEWDELVFIYTSILGTPLGMIFRNVVERKVSGLKLDCLESSGITLPKKAKKGAWFGFDKVNVVEPLLICEGEIDCMRTYEFGWYNTVSPGGMSCTKQQAKALYNKKIYIGFDSDAPGKQGTAQLIKLLPKDTEKWVVDWNVAGAKDPGDLTNKEDFYQCINKAVQI